MSSYDEAPHPDVADQEYGNESEPMKNNAEAEIKDTEPANASLGQDDADAIDKDNIIDERTRGAQPAGGYREPGDNEGIPTDE